VTDPEFQVFAKRLFIAFPSLWSWLQENSPDPKETQAIWRETLRPYHLDECLAVVESWSSGQLKPFEAYERDKVHLFIRSIISARRDRRSKRESQAQELGDFRRARRGPFDITACMDQPMLGAFQELCKAYVRVRDGTMTADEYESFKSESFKRHKI